MLASHTPLLSEAPPPPYHANNAYDGHPTEAKAAAHDAAWDKIRPMDWKTLSWCNMKIWFGEKQVNGEEEWAAWLVVHAKCIPHLMRHGFHWLKANILTEKSFVALGSSYVCLTPAYIQSGYLHTRTFFLENSQHDSKNQEWIGMIKVFAKNVPTVAAFRLEWLSLNTMKFVRAWNWDRKLVYQYNSSEPENNFNVIYENMPLQGWRPWPKAPEV